MYILAIAMHYYTHTTLFVKLSLCKIRRGQDAQGVPHGFCFRKRTKTKEKQHRLKLLFCQIGFSVDSIAEDERQEVMDATPPDAPVVPAGEGTPDDVHVLAGE